MKEINLILTFDYELYGDGSGNVFTHMIEPTTRILNILDKNNIKSTIFFEVIEYWKLKEQWNMGNMMGYEKNPILAIEDQLINAYRNGHDVQLHLHPQWINSKWENNKWHIDKSLWRLGDFSEFNGYTINDLISDGKKTLEKMIKPIDPYYSCHTIRAGGFNILPSENILSVIEKLNFRCESSVYPGGFEDGKLSKYDYRSVDIRNDFWYIDQDVLISCEKTKIIELPIFALPTIRLKKIFNRQRILAYFQNRNSAYSNFSDKLNNNKSLISSILFFFEKEYLTWDFCLFSKVMNKRFLNECLKLNKKHNRFNFTLVGHPKNFTNSNALKKLISDSKKLNLSFITISEFIRNR